MPAIDLARLRKQAARLTDFFFVPDEFVKHLHEMLDAYVDYTVRKPQAAAPRANLPTYRTPTVIVKQVEHELSILAMHPENVDGTFTLADRLWEDGWLESRLLAAYLLGCVPPDEPRLLPRLTDWSRELHDPNLRARLLDTSLARLRKQTPAIFLELIGKWLSPDDIAGWANGIQAVIAAAADPGFKNLPPLLKVIEPVVKAAPSKLQPELEELILGLYAASPTETIYFVRQILIDSQNPMTAITFRRMSPSFPIELQEEIREFIRGKLY